METACFLFFWMRINFSVKLMRQISCSCLEIVSFLFPLFMWFFHICLVQCYWLFCSLFFGFSVKCNFHLLLPTTSSSYCPFCRRHEMKASLLSWIGLQELNIMGYKLVIFIPCVHFWPLCIACMCIKFCRTLSMLIFLHLLALLPFYFDLET